jgi:hypothetical protein
LSPDPDDHFPFLLNFSVGENSQWRHAEVKPLPPVCVPPSLSSFGTVFALVDGADEYLLQAALRIGIALNIKQLKFIIGTLQVVVPARGTGKTGAVVKPDLAKALVEHFFADADEADKARMIAAILGATRQSKPDASLVLQVVANMDPENAACPGFQHLRKAAVHELEHQLLKKGAGIRKAADADAEGGANQDGDATQPGNLAAGPQPEPAAGGPGGNFVGAPGEHDDFVRTAKMTPLHLKLLLPLQGAVPGMCYLKKHPIKKYFRAEYPCR